MALMHGLPKVMKILGGDFTFADPLGLGPTVSLILAGSAEFFGGLLIAAGLFTRLAVLPYLFTMLVAAFIVHWGDPWGKMATPLHYAIAATVLICTGPGRYSLDHKLFVTTIKP
jgi:putative oxidoreductase